MLSYPKLRRELRRIKDQIKSWGMLTYEPWLRWNRRQHPERYFKLLVGDVHQPDKLAIYLVYQPHGLEPSTLMSLRHFSENGYAVFLVSNARLRDEDIQKVRPHCWKLMERQNFGYDFGGYQDAVMQMWAVGLKPESLVIINDSIWFPTRSSCDLLGRMEQSTAQFVGAFQLEPTRSKNPSRNKRPFMGSFFWHLKKDALESKAFADFWTNYKATSSKYATIRRGERRFTHHLLDSGIVGEPIYSRHQFDGWLNKLQGAALYRTLEELCTTDPILARQQQALLNQSSITTDWEKQAMDLAISITAPQNIMATAPMFMVRDMKMPFLKKSTDEANKVALRLLLRYWRKEPSAIDITVCREVSQRVKE